MTRAPRLSARALAHVFDLFIVNGVSVYGSKLFTFALLALYSRPLSAAGSEAEPIFEELYDLASSQLLAACIAAVAVVYFVGLPLLIGRTLGQGLFGMRIVSNEGRDPTARQLVYRLFYCLVTYASFGLLCLVGLRQRNGRFAHDSWSDSQITRS